MGCDPKCLFAAGPDITNVMFEYWTSEVPSVPPLMQTWSVVGPSFSKDAAFPLPEIKLAGPVATKRAVFAGLKVGQVLVSDGSDETVASVMTMWCVWAPRLFARCRNTRIG
jgi:hypothetical protein